MESPHVHSSERAHPHYPRSVSRSSTSTSNTRVTSKSGNSSASHTSRSSRLSSSHSHRYQHSSCMNPSTPRTPTPRALPSDAGTGSPRKAATSSFLQEKLERERKVESEKASSVRSSRHLSASLDLGRAIQNLPAKSGEADTHRPQSSGQDSTTKGLGILEMDQVMSNLHKQNFDLKLELHHRRDLQIKMEEKLETLESEKTEMEEVNETLIEELEKREKAVEEAVAMIVSLEARVDHLLEERNIVRNIEAEEQYEARNSRSAYDSPTPPSKAADFGKLEADANTISRMPSFLIEHTENAENLRNVYLEIRGSMLSLPPLVEGPCDTDNGPVTGLESPSPSVLSKSSFASIYGNKEKNVETSQQARNPRYSGNNIDAVAGKATAIGRSQSSMGRIQQSSRARSHTTSGAGDRASYQALSSMIGKQSPLQRIERTFSLKQGELQPKSHNQLTSSPHLTPASAMSAAQRRAKEEKREALRKVMTDAPGGLRTNDPGFPPTPDTISTSTLRRFQASDDTLSRNKSAVLRRSYDSMSNHSINDDGVVEHTGVKLDEASPLKDEQQHARDFSWNSCAESQAPVIRQSRSAAESTIPRRRGNDWGSESDSDEDWDNRSLGSSLDVWMRQGPKPNNTGRTVSSTPMSKMRTGLSMDAMFDYGNVSEWTGRTSTGIDPDRIQDLFPVQEVLFGPSATPPPPPNRRSSLHAQTGSSSRTTTMKSSARGSMPSTPVLRNRPSRRNSDAVSTGNESKTPVQANEQKRSHYPPISGQQSARHGLNRLFRRSISGALPTQSVGTPPTIKAEDPFQEHTRSSSVMGFPPWIERSGMLDDDRESATPPPIMRSPRKGRPAPVKVDAPRPKSFNADPLTPATSLPSGEPMTPSQQSTSQGGSPMVSSATGHKRKWLPGFGLATSLRNRHNSHGH